MNVTDVPQEGEQQEGRRCNAENTKQGPLAFTHSILISANNCFSLPLARRRRLKGIGVTPAPHIARKEVTLHQLLCNKRKQIYSTAFHSTKARTDMCVSRGGEMSN